MENIPLKLETSFAHGNSTGRQIDTLSVAVCGSDFNDILDNSHEYIDSNVQYAIDNFDYESAFLSTLSKAKARAYITDADGYARDLKAYTENLKETVHDYDLRDEAHPLVVEMEKAREDAETELYKEWVYGDYRNAGLLRDASRKYGIELSYDEKADALSFDIEEGELADLVEYKEVKKTKKALSAYFSDDISMDAKAETNKRRQRNEARRAESERTRAYKAERAKEEEARRVERLKHCADI